MSDFRNDPNFTNEPQAGMHEYDNRVQWAAVAVILLLVGGLIVAAAYTGGETQTAMNKPSIETTGSGGGSTFNDPTPPPQLRR